MEDFYLNDQRREFYTKALQLIGNCKNDFWDLDDSISEHLNIINNTPNVRTMYSRRGWNRSGIGLESYLTICYTQTIESQLINDIVPILRVRFLNLKYCEFKFYVERPRIQNEGEVAPYLEYIAHRDYWNVHHLKLELKGGFNDSHDLFWNMLTELLCKL